MEKQKTRSRKASKLIAGDWITLFDDDIEEFEEGRFPRKLFKVTLKKN